MTNGTVMTTSVDAKPLSAHETQAFEHYCKVVDDGLKTFIEVGEALATLKAGNLFRGKYPGRNWEQFVNERWNFSRQRAWQLINASALARDLGTTVSIPNEKVARAFLESELKDNPEAIRFAATIAATSAAATPGRVVTEEWARATAAMVVDAMASEGFVDTGKGDWAAASAAITHEVWVRMKQKQAEIAQKKQKPLIVLNVPWSEIEGEIADFMETAAVRPEKVRIVIYEDVSK